MAERSFATEAQQLRHGAGRTLHVERSLRFGREQSAIDAWLRLAEESARDDYELACEIIECQQVLKGYGETHEHGKESFAVLMDAARRLTGRDGGAGTLARLRAAALADEDGSALRDAVAALDDMPSPTP